MTAASAGTASPGGLDLVAVRRHLHAHPELGWNEHATSAFVVATLRELGLDARPLADGLGAVAEIGAGDGPVVVLRADLDALPFADPKQVPYASTNPGACHACGHDAHTTALLGAAALLVADPPATGRVRLLFQPAEEVMPGGALSLVDQGLLDGVTAAFALHCDPSLDVGEIGLREGPLTAAADHVELVVSGPGGHTSRPQNTVDLVAALATLVSQLPAVLSRRVDPRASLSLVFGAIAAGSAANAIPQHGIARGTLRVLDHAAWERAPDLVTEAAVALAESYGAQVEVRYLRGVPPVVNDATAIAALAAGVGSAVTQGFSASVVATSQSLGGEDFGWMVEKVPGAMARLGTRTPGGPTHDLHQGSFDIDERALPLGAAVLAGAARAALAP